MDLGNFEHVNFVFIRIIIYNIKSIIYFFIG